MHRLTLSSLVTVASLVACSGASAWGRDGHRLVAELAYAQLTPPTRSKVDAILSATPGDTLVSISTWGDEVRSPSTARWHYLNFKRTGGCAFVADRDCPDGQCVVGAIERQVEALKNARTAEAELKALKWVVHLVADVHQPFHAGFGDDRGANLYQVQAFGRGSNLHSVWDSGMILNWPGGLPALVVDLSGLEPPGKQRSLSTPAEWASESCRIASLPEIYPDGRFITEDYAARWRSVVGTRLYEAAWRLARVLERSLVSR
jgi:hypothetical protein